jgi:hypothetical protein
MVVMEAGQADGRVKAGQMVMEVGQVVVMKAGQLPVMEAGQMVVMKVGHVTGEEVVIEAGKMFLA